MTTKTVWAVTWDGDTLSVEDLTAGDAVRLQTLTGDASWEALDPMRDPVHLVAMFTVAAARKMPVDDAIAVIHARPLAELLAATTPVRGGDGDSN